MLVALERVAQRLCLKPASFHHHHSQTAVSQEHDTLPGQTQLTVALSTVCTVCLAARIDAVAYAGGQ